jgi:hypothetical protein
MQEAQLGGLDNSSDWPRHKYKTLFEKYVKQKGLDA